MFDFLLDEKNFSSLKHYVQFLNDLPLALTEIQRFSESFRRSGHVLMSGPNVQALTSAAFANERCWREIIRVVPSLSELGGQLVKQASTFFGEFEKVALEATGSARREPIGSVDPTRFTSINYGSHGTNRPPDVVYLMSNLCLQLDQYAKVAAHFKALIIELSQTVHSIFARFVDALTLRLCTCDAPVSKIEAYYVLGRLSLPNMQYDTDGFYSEAQRRDKAKEHLKMLNLMYTSATSAANNLADFCHRLNFFLVHMKRELRSNDSEQRLGRAQYSLKQIAYPFKELAKMVDTLALLSPKLKA